MGDGAHRKVRPVWVYGSDSNLKQDHMEDIINLSQDVSCEDFFNEVVVTDSGARRMVMRADVNEFNKKHRTPGCETDPYYDPAEFTYKLNARIWVPSSCDDDYNLVLSLAEDGLHYPAFDMDESFLPPASSSEDKYIYIQDESRLREVRLGYGKMVFVPSTTNVHIYTQHGMRFSDYLNLLAQAEKKPHRYKTNVERQGYGALRAPWYQKGSNLK